MFLHTACKAILYFMCFYPEALLFTLQYPCKIVSFNKEPLLYHTLFIFVLTVETAAQGEILHNIYYTPSSVGSFGGLMPLFREAKKQIKTLKIGDACTLHRPARVHFKRNKTIVSKVDAQWQANLVEMQRFAWCNKGCKYILV